MIVSAGKQLYSTGSFLAKTAAKTGAAAVSKFASTMAEAGKKAYETGKKLAKFGLNVAGKAVGGVAKLGSFGASAFASGVAYVGNFAGSVLGMLTPSEKKEHGYPESTKEYAKATVSEAYTSEITPEQEKEYVDYLESQYGLTEDQASSLVDQAEQLAKKQGIPFADALTQITSGLTEAQPQAAAVPTTPAEKPSGIPLPLILVGGLVIGGLVYFAAKSPEKKPEEEAMGYTTSV